MTNRTGASYVVRRIGERAAFGVWRHRGGVAFATLLVVGLGVYFSMFGATLTLPSLATLAAGGASAAGQGANAAGDCADTAMAAVADKSPGAAHQAYNCMAPAFRQRVSETQFSTQLQSQRLANVNKLARLGDYRDPSGGTLVYYALDGNGQSVGYIVYLGQDGKVLKIQ